jgi:gliding motility-associated-like protein
MNRIIRNITTILTAFVVWTSCHHELFAQCRPDNGSPIKGEFSINGNKVNVKGDGGGSLTATNNIPIKICEGEPIILKNELPINAITSNDYWITELNSYKLLTTSLAGSGKIKDASYSTRTGNASLRLISKSADPSGINSYNGPGIYVITQYDNSSSIAGGPDFHHACQVIEIIATPKPLVTAKVCSGNEIQLTFPASATNNIFDDYEITFKATVGNISPTVTTGKPTTYPFTVKSGTILTDNQDRIVSVRGTTVTGNCSAPPADLGQISLSPTTIFKPVVSAVIGTSNKGEFKLAVSAQNTINRNLYFRDPNTSNSYLYTNVFKTYSSTAALMDTIVLKVTNGDKMYCFQAEALDLACPSTGSNPNLRSNEEICTTPATVTAENNKNVVTWLKAPDGLINSVFQFYQVARLNSNGTIDKLFPAIPTVTELKIEDTEITCGQEYTYRVQTNYNQKSYSQIIRVKAVSGDVPTKIPLIYTTIDVEDKNAVNVQGLFSPNLPPANILSYNLYKSDTYNGTYNPLISAKMKADGLFIDNSAEVEKKSYCYYMTYKNLCGKESDPSEKVCTIYLTGNNNSIKWTTETPFSEPVGYYIAYQIDPSTNRPISGRPTIVDNFKGSSTDKISRLPESDGQEIFVQIHAEPLNTGLGGGNGRFGTSVSNIFKIFRSSLILSPQIFTPNGDKVNDKFLVEGRFIKTLKMTIYDRWGNSIFYDEQTNYPYQGAQNPDTVIGWDGTMNNGSKAMEGSYTFKIEVEDTIGQITTKEGALLLAY